MPQQKLCAPPVESRDVGLNDADLEADNPQASSRVQRPEARHLSLNTAMSRSHLLAFGAAILLAAAPPFLAACDSNPVSDVESLLTDARIARQAGDLDQAIALLESAMALSPENAPVRVELSSAYLDREDVDLLDVDRVALFLTTFADNATDSPGGTSQSVGGTCRYAEDPNAQLFAPGDYQGYGDLYSDRELIDSVVGLLNGVDPSNGSLSIVPDELRVLNLCTGIVDGELFYDGDTALASMRALGLNDNEIATALAVNAVSRFFEAYFHIVEDIPQQTDWYHVASQSSDYIGVCAEDEEALRGHVEVAILDLGEAVTSLDLRDQLLGGTTASQELVQHVLDAYEAVQADLGPYCDGGQ